MATRGVRVGFSSQPVREGFMNRRGGCGGNTRCGGNIREGFEQQKAAAVTVPVGTQPTVIDHSAEGGSFNLPFANARYVPPVIDYNDYVDVDESVTLLGTSVSALQGRVTVNEGGISTNVGGIATNVGGISSNLSNISTNVGNIATNTGGVAGNLGSITINQGDIATSQGLISTNQSNIQTNTTNIQTNTDNIVGLTTRVDSIESNIANVDVDIANLLTRVETNEGNVIILDGLIKDIDERTQYLHCSPGVGCIVYDKATNTPLSMYADKFQRRKVGGEPPVEEP
jgi:hypothetical protein